MEMIMIIDVIKLFYFKLKFKLSKFFYDVIKVNLMYESEIIYF